MPSHLPGTGPTHEPVVAKPPKQAPAAGGARASLAKHDFLQPGAKGAQVKLLQKKLIDAGMLNGNASGTFDPETASAVKKFQKKIGLEVDGCVGQQTWGAIYGLKVPPGSDLLKGGAPSGGSTGVSGSGGASSVSDVKGPTGDKLKWAMDLAKKMGLTITSTPGGSHAPGSSQSRAIDVAGAPSKLAAYYDAIKAKTSPTELFYDPRGGTKNGAQLGATGGHGPHVHVAF